MKLRNKKTGKIHNFIIDGDEIRTSNLTSIYRYSSLAELNEEWEDCKEEPCFVSEFGKVHPISCMGGDRQRVKWLKEVGNYFETEKEAEKAVEKFKALKRLKDARFRFIYFDYNLDEISSSTIGANGKIDFDMMCYEDFSDDLELLFGDEQ